MGDVMFNILIGYWINILYGIDVLANIIIGGDRRETISSRLGKGRVADKPVHNVLVYPVDLLFLILTGDKNHCVNSIQDFDDYYSVSSMINRGGK